MKMSEFKPLSSKPYSVVIDWSADMCSYGYNEWFSSAIYTYVGDKWGLDQNVYPIVREITFQEDQILSYSHAFPAWR